MVLERTFFENFLLQKRVSLKSTKTETYVVFAGKMSRNVTFPLQFSFENVFIGTNLTQKLTPFQNFSIKYGALKEVDSKSDTL